MEEGVSLLLFIIKEVYMFDINKFKKPVWLYKEKDIYTLVEKGSDEYKRLKKDGWVENRAEAGKVKKIEKKSKKKGK